MKHNGKKQQFDHFSRVVLWLNISLFALEMTLNLIRFKFLIVQMRQQSLREVARTLTEGFPMNQYSALSTPRAVISPSIYGRTVVEWSKQRIKIGDLRRYTTFVIYWQETQFC